MLNENEIDGLLNLINNEPEYVRQLSDAELLEVRNHLKEEYKCDFSLSQVTCPKIKWLLPGPILEDVNRLHSFVAIC